MIIIKLQIIIHADWHTHQTQTLTHRDKNKLLTLHSYFKLNQLRKMNGKRKYERRHYLNADCG